MLYSLTEYQRGGCSLSWFSSQTGRHFKSFPSMDDVCKFFNVTVDKMFKFNTPIEEKRMGIKAQYSFNSGIEIQ